MKLLPSIAILACGAVAACAHGSPPPAASTTRITSAEPEPVACEVECGGASVVPEPARAPEPDYHAAAVADADRVMASMRDDLLACYEKRLATNPQARAFVMLDIVLQADGRVRRVDATGGGMLGDAALTCMTSRVTRASFAPVHGGGTLRLQVPLTLRPVGAGESI